MTTVPKLILVVRWYAVCDACGQPTAEHGWASELEMVADQTADGWWMPGWSWVLCPECVEIARTLSDTGDLPSISDRTQILPWPPPESAASAIEAVTDLILRVRKEVAA